MHKLRGAAIAAVAIAAPASAQVEVGLRVLADAPLYGHQNFGREALAVAGATGHAGDSLMVVKAFERGAECPTSDPIRVYRLGPSGWELEASFTHRSGFISNIEIDNDTLVIAEDPSFSNREGRIRVYRRANRAWTLEDEFGQNDPEPWDFFGRSIALDGDTLAVGAPNEGSGSTFGRPVDGPGAVYVFRRSGSSWSQIDKIGDGDRAGDRTGRLDQFGRQVDVIEHGGRARVMVSAPLHRPDEFTASGVVMLFDENDGFDDYQLYGSDEADDSGFGYQLTLSDGVAGIASLGRLRLYRFDGDRLRLWETVNIERDSINRLDSEGEVIAVGRPFRDDLGPVTGSISIWDWGPINGFVTVVREAVTDLEDGDQYGAQVVIGGGFFHVGVPFHDFAGPDTGAVYSYGLDSTPTEPRGSLASKFFTGDAVPGARFAEDLDTDGARMIAGLPGNVPCPTGRGGSAFIYTLQDQVWSREQNLAVEDVDPDARFGAAVSVYGDTAAVGAPADGPNDTGSVHIFERSHLGWSRVARLVPSQARGGEGFGWDIDLQAGRITIGVPGGWTGNERTGYAITYTRTAQGWLPESRLALPSGFDSFDRVGESVAMDGDRIAVGAPGFADGAGAALVYDDPFDDLSARGPIVRQNATTDDRLGAAVAIAGREVLIGVPGRGEVMVVETFSGGWNEQIESPLTSSTPGFGSAVAAQGLAAAVGAPGEQAEVFYLEAGHWTSYGVLNNPTGVAADGYGRAVAIHERELVVGAPLGDRFDVDSGVAYGYILDFSFLVPECPEEVAANEIRELDPVPDDSSAWFGYRLDADADTAVVGGPYVDLEGEDFFGNPVVFGGAGEVRVYKRTGLGRWTLQAKLHEDVAESVENSRHGQDVAVSGDLVVVGMPVARGNRPATGKARVYRRDRLREGDRWVVDGELFANPDANYTQFGETVDIDGATAVVGTRQVTGVNGEAGVGAAWVYERDAFGAWGTPTEIRPDDGVFADHFGSDAALDGDWLAVAAINADMPGMFSTGAVYLYRREQGAWIERDKLLPPDPEPNAGFGHSLDMENGILVVGANYIDTAFGNNTGAAYVYRLDQNSRWNLEQRIVSPLSENSDQFGRSVSVAGSTIAVGSISAYTPNRRGRPGAVDVFVYDPGVAQWRHRERAQPRNTDGVLSYGESVALAGGNLWVGANRAALPRPGVPNPPLETGRAYAVDLECRLPTCPIDLAPPFGVISQADAAEFIRLFSAADPAVAAIAPPFDVVSQADVLEFVRYFLGTCP